MTQVSQSFHWYLPAFALLLLASSFNCQARQEAAPNSILSYLYQESAALSADFPPADLSSSSWERERPERHRQFLEMMGFSLEQPRDAPIVRHTGTVVEEGFRIEKFFFESMPGLYVPANLYLPETIDTPVPLVLYLCGHAPGQKAHYQAHPRKLAQLGFASLIFDTVQFGEVAGHHWGPYNQGWFHWYSRGYNPAAVELWNAIRALDYLAERKEIDMENVGVTGISGGGSQTWYLAAADSRIKAAAPVCGAGTLDSQVGDRRIDGHCDCMMPHNAFQWDFTDIGALIAPRPLLIAQSDRDELYGIESTRAFHKKLASFYESLGAAGQVRLVETPGGHSYHKKSRTAIFSFFLEHLMGKDISPEELTDIETDPAALLTAEKLQVYTEGAPEEDLTPVIQDHFLEIAPAPVILNEADLLLAQRKTKDYLQRYTFGAFPDQAASFDGKEIYRTDDLAPYGNKTFSFTSEKGWRLKLNVFYRQNPEEAHPLLIVLRSPGELRWDSESFAQKIARGQNVAYLEVRGTGEVGWAPELNWHVRRAAAWTGRTLPSMQVYDALRAIAFARELPGVDPKKISIAAREGMGLAAMYAALLDGSCEKLILSNPPETHNRPSPVHGMDTALELLGVLKRTDMYQIPALLYSTQTIFLGAVPEAYLWSEKSLKAAGKNGFIRL
jgi:dienelactone hydrolase